MYGALREIVTDLTDGQLQQLKDAAQSDLDHLQAEIRRRDEVKSQQVQIEPFLRAVMSTKKRILLKIVNHTKVENALFQCWGFAGTKHNGYCLQREADALIDLSRIFQGFMKLDQTVLIMSFASMENLHLLEKFECNEMYEVEFEFAGKHHVGNATFNRLQNALCSNEITVSIGIVMKVPDLLR